MIVYDPAILALLLIRAYDDGADARRAGDTGTSPSRRRWAHCDALDTTWLFGWLGTRRPLANDFQS